VDISIRGRIHISVFFTNDEKSGTTKKETPRASAKTLTIWLKYIRDITVVEGKPVQQLSSHSYRHTLAMRYLTVGNKFENVAMIQVMITPSTNSQFPRAFGPQAL